MATKIAIADTAFTTATTWGDVATASNSLLNSESGSTTLTTSYVESQVLTPGAVTIDAIAVKVSGRATSASGTISCRLAAAGVLVAGTEVTINVSDIPRANALGSDLGNGWILFKLAAPVLLVAATNYTVSLKTSVSSQVACFRDGTAANWDRMLRTTTTGAPGAGDNWYILGEWTAAGVKTNRTVTMDSTAATDYGGASTTIESFGIGVGGTLTWGTTAATAYILRLSGILQIFTSGTMTMGTVATPCPRDGSQELRWDSAADGDFGFICWGTLTIQGLSRTISKNVVQCLLNTDEAIAQTVLGVDTDTGWLNADEINIASTTQTYTQAETATLSGNAAATTVTVTAGIAAAHSGTSPNQAEVILLTRNVRMTAVTTTAMWYGQLQSGAVADWDWADFRYLGTTVSAKYGISVNGAITTFTMDFCGFRDGEGNAVVGMTGGSGAIVANDCTFSNIGCGGASVDVFRVENGTCSIALTRCTCIFDNNTSNNWAFLDVSANGCLGVVVDSCRVSSGIGLAVSLTADLSYTIPKILRSCIFHCMGGSAGGGVINIAPSTFIRGLLIDSCQIRRCPLTSAAIGALHLASCSDVLVNNTSVIASANGVCIHTQGYSIRFTNCTFAGDASFTQTQGLLIAQGQGRFCNIRVENCSFGAGTAHVTADIAESSISARFLELTLVNTSLASATEFTAAFVLASNYVGDSFISQQRKDGTTGIHQTLFLTKGTIAIDTVTFRTVAPSEKLTPIIGVLPSTAATHRFRSSSRAYPVATGKKITFNAYVQKDGSYNGLAPRLVLLANPAVGIDDDVTLDTLTVSSGNWELLTGQMSVAAEEAGLMRAVVECDGSAGNIYVDDWSAATN